MFERFVETNDYLRLPVFSKGSKVDVKGNLLDKDGKPIETFTDPSGELRAKLEWVNGYGNYRVAELVAFAFKCPKLPFKYWNQLTVEFLDKDVTNIHPSNLVWRFPKMLGIEDNNGFCYIPMFSRYLVNREGVVFDSISKRVMTAYYKKGYYVYSLIPDIGPRAPLMRHRAICLAFKDYPTEVDNRQVNHINGCCGDDWLENLEWVTCSENRIHAVKNGLTSVNKPIVVTNLNSQESVEYKTLKDYCDDKNNSFVATHRMLQSSGGCYHLDGYEIAYKNKEHVTTKMVNQTPILVRDVLTGKVDEYPSIVACAKALGITKHVVMWRINTPTTSLMADFKQLKRKSDPTPWYEPDDPEKETLECSWTKAILVRNVITQVLTEYESQRHASKALSVAESTMTKWVNSINQPVFKDGLGNLVQLKLKSDQSSWRSVTDPAKELSDTYVEKAVLVKDLDSGDVAEYSSCVQCATELGVLPTTLNWRLKSNGQKVYDKHLLFKYKNSPAEFLY